ncbi:MAG: TIR domain-containing protein [Chloroflexi bacterium]|nr:TIR domain-containing protein [Chloroflexota bacterium]
MNKKSVFISFDYDNDNDLRGTLVAQAEDLESPFNITDWSVKRPIDEAWKKDVLDRICKVDLTIVICGEHTHDAEGVEAEVTMIQQLKKPYFLLKGRRRKTCTRPKSAPKRKKMHPWTWPTLQKLLADPRQA